MNQHEALSTAISITDEILELLEDQNFERVGELELKRKSYIEKAFVESIEEIDLIRAHHLKDLNQQVVEKLNSFKQSVLQQQSQVRIATKATRVYQSVDSVPR